MLRTYTRFALIAALTGTPLAAQSSSLIARAPGAAAFDSARFGGLHWRNIGPFRGGRVTTAAGVATQPLVFYMGAAGGGIWKTENAGSTWHNVSDGKLHTGSVGSLAVAPSDPNVVYAGMGEREPRGQSSTWGDGIYRSTDAGKTWRSLGLEKTRSIAQLSIDPHNADVVIAAVEGSRWTPSADRGVYKTTDGGATWKLVLHPNDSIAAIDVTRDPANPRLVYAAMWDFQRLPYQIRSGGAGSAIYRSTDGGDSWTRLSGHGLPTGLVGRIGVSASAAQAGRVFAIIEAAADTGGLYRSDDGGDTWQHLSADRLIRSRSWYYTRVMADPQDPNVVYVMNSPIVKSIDGGKTFQVLPAKHGDNHDLWINPLNHSVMINANDGGASVSVDGGATWSTQDNQPTAQIYRVNTDAQYPYWVYGAQQDNTSLAIRSAAPGGITTSDWFALGGCESAHVALDPEHPRYLYAGCYQGAIDEYDRETQLTRSIMAYPALGLSTSPVNQRYRFNWSAPIVTSPLDHSVIYHGGSHLFRSTDRGQTWTVISPDLTRNEKAKQGPGGAPITNEGAGGEVYNTIYYIAPSARDANTIWVGTDDGLVQLTHDGGRTWTNVTPKMLAPGFVNAIELSPFDTQTAYMTYDGYKYGDVSPQIYKTTDDGRTWTKLVAGIRDGDQVRVVRADPARRGLLFAGTETGAYVSFNDGQRWESLQANLPVVPVTDLQLRAGDLVASTEGRAFWIMDDIAPLEQGADGVAPADSKLFAPRPAHLTFWGQGATDSGTNPPSGATIYYHIGAGTDSATVTLEILDASGAVVRSYAGKAEAGGGTGPARTISGAPGMHRAVWDLRSAPLDAPKGLTFFGSTEGAVVAPGDYTVRLTAGGRALTALLRVLPDPRVQLSPAQLAEQARTMRAIAERSSEIFRDVKTLNDVRDQVKAIVAHAADLPNADTVRVAGKRLAARADSLSADLVQPQHTNGQDIINFPNGVVDEWLYLGGTVNGAYMPVTGGQKERLADLQQQWTAVQARIDEILKAQVPAFNALLGGRAVVIVPAARPSVVP